MSSDVSNSDPSELSAGDFACYDAGETADDAGTPQRAASFAAPEATTLDAAELCASRDREEALVATMRFGTTGPKELGVARELLVRARWVRRSAHRARRAC